MCAGFDGPFNIGEAAARSGVSAKMIRHYEALGLLPKVTRTDSGYRQYTESDVHTLRFVRRGRALGFSMAEIAELLKLWQNKRRASSDVKRIALAHAEDLSCRIEELESMKRSLERLAECCQGDQRTDCPIIDELAELTGFAGCHEPTAGALLQTA
jgi:MerR family transcriptional regulator, copper efflux regulator